VLSLIIYWIPACAGKRLEALRSFVFPAEAGIYRLKSQVEK